MNKKLTITLLSVLIISGAGYYGFWFSQAKKFETIIVNMVEQINEKNHSDSLPTHQNISYSKIKKSGFPWNITLKIQDIKLKTTKKQYDLSSLNPDGTTQDTIQQLVEPRNNDSTNSSGQTNPIIPPVGTMNNPQMSERIVVINTTLEEVEIKADLLLKKFTLSNDKKIRIEDEKKEISELEFKPTLHIDLKKSITNISNMGLSTVIEKLDDINLLEYENKGFKLKKENGELINESEAKNLFKILNHSQKPNYNLDLMIDFNNKKNKKIDDNNKKSESDKLVNFFKYSDLRLDLNIKVTDKKNENNNLKTIDIEIKKIDWDTEHSAIKASGKVTSTEKDFVPLGQIDHEFINYKNLLDDIEKIFLNYDNENNQNNQLNNQSKGNITLVRFLRKILPEIANDTSNNGENLKIIYLREIGKPTMIGTKNIEELSSEYIKYITAEKN